jgi:3-oxoacyl-[acyl-carrier protein] reductase|tara:strand:- start:2094 stop:2837 length:744 start_codon:yes stop_codon:yes gene_type:complete
MDDSPTVALVTGASRGIGRAISIELGKMGHVVVGTATTQQGADNISAYMAEQGIKGKGFAADVSNDDSVSALMAAITKEFSAPLIVVNNAGITRDNLLMRMKTGEWEDVINTNLGSMYRICKATVKGMTKARFGRIVNISSVVGSSGNGGQTNYSASKAGIEGFTRSLAKEIGSRGITVNAVAPGFIATDMTKDLPEAQTFALLSQIPLARLGQPEEIAGAVGFLVSDKGAYVTGETLHVNGGMYMG